MEHPMAMSIPWLYFVLGFIAGSMLMGLWREWRLERRIARTIAQVEMMLRECRTYLRFWANETERPKSHAPTAPEMKGQRHEV